MDILYLIQLVESSWLQYQYGKLICQQWLPKWQTIEPAAAFYKVEKCMTPDLLIYNATKFTVPY